MHISHYKKAVLALIVANIIWGLGPPIFKWSFQNVSPLTLAFFRFVIPIGIMLPFVGKLQRVRIRDAFYFLMLGIFNCALNISLYFLGLRFTASINQPVIASAGPIFILLGSAIWLRDKATKRVLFGNLVGLAGVLFIVLEPIIADHHYSSFFGNFLFVLSTISASIGTLFSKRLAKKYNPFTLAFWTFFIASLALLPVFIEELNHHSLLDYLSLQGLTGILFGAIFSSLGGYFLFYYGLRYIKASESTIFSYIDPVAAVIVAIPLLGEYPNPTFLIGSFLVFFGIYIAEKRIHWHPLHKLFG